MKTKTEKIKELSASEITKEAIKQLTEAGYYVWRQANVAPRGRQNVVKAGVPDIIGWDNDKIIIPIANFVACEVKKLGDTLKPAQKEFLTNLKKSGGLAFLATQVGREVKVMPF